MDLPSVSVVVATRNRAAALRSFLESAKGWLLNRAGNAQLIVVDNGSNDDTAATLRSFRGSLGDRLIIDYEATPGKSNALNRGIGHAKGEILAFTDDDCFPSDDWLDQIVLQFGRDPRLGLVGGRVELHNLADLPVTVRTSRERRQLVPTDNLFSLIAGCNMVVRRQVALTVGPFDQLLGPGARFEAAEDIDFIYRVWKADWDVQYVPGILVFHNHGRRTHAQVEALNRAYVRGRAAFYAKYLLAGDTKIARLAYWEVRGLLPWRRSDPASIHRSQSAKVRLGDLAASMLAAGIAYLGKKARLRP